MYCTRWPIDGRVDGVRCAAFLVEQPDEGCHVLFDLRPDQQFVPMIWVRMLNEIHETVLGEKPHDASFLSLVVVGRFRRHLGRRLKWLEC
jgi:hypothetical protein